MTPVSDSTPLILFARVRRLGILHDLFGEIVIPPAVYAEIVVDGPPKPGTRAITKAAWIHRAAPPDLLPFAFPNRLGSGEREAVALACALNVPLLTDDRSAGRFASSVGVRVTRTLSLLSLAEAEGLIPDAEELLHTMLQTGLRLHPDVIVDFQAQLRVMRRTTRAHDRAA